MEKCKCGNKYNKIVWHEIIADGERQQIGGDAYKNKLDIAHAMKYTDYFKGYYNDCKIVHRSYNHCFICGAENNLIEVTV